MAKFGVDFITDEARDKLEELNIPYRRVAPHKIDIYTENFDLRFDEEREREVRPNDPDRPKMVRAQGVRVWKHPESGDYYYLINDWVFFKQDRITKDYSTYPATQHVVTIFDSVDEQDQDSFRTILLSRPPMFETGVLL